MRRIRAFFYKRRGFLYDYAKRMWTRTRSDCHNAPVYQVASWVKKQKDYKYAWFCSQCKKRCTPKYEFKHER